MGLVEKLEGVKIAAFQEWLHKPIIDDIILGHVTYCGRVLGLEKGATALLSNGRVSHCNYGIQTYFCMQHAPVHAVCCPLYTFWLWLLGFVLGVLIVCKLISACSTLLSMLFAALCIPFGCGCLALYLGS